MDKKELLRAVQLNFGRRYQHYIDKTTVYTAYRWIAFAILLSLYGVRVYLLDGFYIVTYGLAIYMLNLFIGFLSPQMDPETEGPVLPVRTDEEYRPFQRRIPEFVFWHSAARAVVIAFCLTFFSLFDIPVFWPILVLYFVVLFGLTMKNQISHMIKYRYIPWSWGKAKYGGGPGGIAGAAGKKGKGAGSGPVIAGLGIASSSSSLGAGTVAAGAGGSEPRFTGSNLK